MGEHDSHYKAVVLAPTHSKRERLQHVLNGTNNFIVETMPNSLTTEMTNNLESDKSPNILYDDDLSEDAVFVTELEISEEPSGFLSDGGNEENPVDPQSICNETGTTYAYLVAHSRVRASLKRPVRLCKFSKAPACLFALEINVQEPQYRNLRRLLRFKAMTVCLEFEDGDGDCDKGPDVVMFCPETFRGEPTAVEHSNSSTMRASIGTPSTIPVGITLGTDAQHGTKFTKSCQVKIDGEAILDGDRPTIVQWTVEEDAALREGVPKKLKFAIAVTHLLNRAFKVKLDIQANLGFIDLVQYPTKGSSSMCIKIDPARLAEQAAQDHHSEAHGQIWHCETVDSELSAADLIGKTNLKDPVVGCTSDIV